MFNLIKLKEHIKTYFYRNLNELLTSTNKTTITLVKKLISDYNARLSSDRIFRDVEKAYIKSSLAKDPLANDITNILNRLLTKEIKQDPEIAEAFYYNNKKFSNKDMHLDLTSDRIDGSILIEEQTVITKNSIELKKESKITTKKIVSIELNTSIAKNILKKLDKNSKFLKDFCADYVNSLNSGVIEYDKSGQVRFPSLAFSVQVKKYISDKIKNNDHLDLEEINALNKQIDFFAKLDLMPIETLRKISEIGFNQSKELMTAVTSDNMLLENKQIILNGDKILEEEEVDIKNKKDEFFNALQNFNISKQ